MKRRYQTIGCGMLLLALLAAGCGSRKTAGQEQIRITSGQTGQRIDSVTRQEQYGSSRETDWNRQQTDDERTTVTAERFDAQGRITARITAVKERTGNEQQQMRQTSEQSGTTNSNSHTDEKRTTAAEQTAHRSRTDEKQETTLPRQMGGMLVALALVLAICLIGRWKKWF